MRVFIYNENIKKEETMSKAVKDRKKLKRQTGNGIEVRRTLACIDAKISAQRNLEGAQRYDLRMKMQRLQLTANYGRLYGE